MPERTISNVACALSSIVVNKGVIERIETLVRTCHHLQVRAVDLLHVYLFERAHDETAFPAINLDLFQAAARAVCEDVYASPAEQCTTVVTEKDVERLVDEWDGVHAPTSAEARATLRAMRFVYYSREVDAELATRAECPSELIEQFLPCLSPDEDVARNTFLPLKEKQALDALAARGKLASEMRELYQRYMEEVLVPAEDYFVVDGTNLDQHVVYAANMWLANAATNMQEHFRKHLRRFIGARLDENGNASTMSSADRKQFKRELWRLTDDVLHGNWSSLDTYEEGAVSEELKALLPDLEHVAAYELKAQPLSFVRAALLMQRKVIAMEHKPLAVIPEPDANVWGYVKIDQRLAASHLLTDEDVHSIGVPRTQLARELKHRAVVWSKLLRTDLRRFCPNKQRQLEFSGCISTDGCGVSIQLCTAGSGARDRVTAPPKATEPYITDAQFVTDKRAVVAIDLNKRDVLYMGRYAVAEGQAHALKTSRYTSMQIRRETGLKRFRIAREHRRGLPLPGQDGASIANLEGSLPRRFARTLDGLFERFRERTRVAVLARPRYEHRSWRSMRLSGKLLTVRSEAAMIKRFASEMGPPDKVKIAFGDSDVGHMRHNAPVKGVGYRKVFRQAGYAVFLAGEHRTSTSCPCGRADVVSFIARKTPRPYRKGYRVVHGLLSCQACNTLWNRDTLAVVNMLECVDCAVHRGDRPARLKHQPRQRRAAQDQPAAKRVRTCVAAPPS